MTEAVAIYQQVIMMACLALLCILCVVVFCNLFAKYGKIVKRKLNRTQLIAFVIAAIVCTYAAQKRLVTFPTTESGVRYLTDAGSYVDSTNDLVYINFTRHIIVPESASLYIDYRERASTNDNEWVNHTTTTFALLNEMGGPPISFVHPNATNFSWIVYTDWTPGPTVVTNGVWHASWAISTNGLYYVPLNTEIYLDGAKITPDIDLVPLEVDDAVVEEVGE